MKKMILYFLVFVSFSLTSSEVNLNLTGTYETKKNIDKKGNNLGNEGFILVKDLGNSKIKLQLEYYGKNSDYGPNMGELSVVLNVKSKQNEFSKKLVICFENSFFSVEKFSNSLNIVKFFEQFIKFGYLNFFFFWAEFDKV